MMQNLDPIIQSLFSVQVIPALLIFISLTALVGRVMLFYLKRGTLYFTNEFSIRVRRHLRGEYHESYRQGMFDTIRYLSDKTIYDIFELRKMNRRRRFDTLKSQLDSLFYIDHGATVFFDDLTDQVSYIHTHEKVDWDRFIRFVLVTNPVFNHLFGFISIELVEKFYKLLPFVVSLIGVLATAHSYTTIGLYESLHFCYWGFGMGLMLAFSNASFHTARYDKIVISSLSWSMFLLWANRSDVNAHYGKSNEEDIEEDRYAFMGSAADFALATEETFQLVSSTELPPDLPEFPDLSKKAA